VITIALERPFKNREEVKNIINKCNIAGGILAILGVLFALVGVIGDALDINVILESSNWLLLAILFVVGSFGPNLNSLMAKHLYGIESENKNK
jgi:hypothetical protein